MADDAVDHPNHYGGEFNPYEAIKVIEAWNLGFRLGNCVKYISRAGKKGPDGPGAEHVRTEPARKLKELEDLKKARWYLDREITKLEDAHAES